jgi:hypothetical protein
MKELSSKCTRRKRCIRQFALIVAMNVKCHSNLTGLGQCTAESVIRREDLQERDFKLS